MTWRSVLGSGKKSGDKKPDDGVTRHAEEADERHATNVAAESVQAIRNAAQYECKELDGPDAFVHCTISVSLIELPRKKGEGPEAKTAFVRIKQTDPIASETAVKMLEAAASQILFQRDDR